MNTRFVSLNYGLLAAVLGFAAAAPAMAAHTTELASPVKLIKELRGFASDARLTADNLESVTHELDVSWQTDATELDKLKGAINSMGRIVATLENEHDTLPAADRALVDKVYPLLKDMADNTTEAITTLMANPERAWQQPYTSHVVKADQDSGELVSLLRHLPR